MPKNSLDATLEEKRHLHDSLVRVILAQKISLGVRSGIVLTPIGYDFRYFERRVVTFDAQSLLPHGGKHLYIERSNLEQVTVSFWYGGTSEQPEYFISHDGRILQTRFTAGVFDQRLCVTVMCLKNN